MKKNVSGQKVGVQMLTAGWSRPGNSGKATLRRVCVRGATCSLYSWGEPLGHCEVEAHECRFQGASWVVSIGESTGPDCVYYDLHRCTIDGDFEKYGPGAGHTEFAMLIGLLARGGRIRAYDCGITCRGTTKHKLVCGAWTTNVDSGADWGGGKWPLIQLTDSPIMVTPNGAAEEVPTKVTIGRIDQR